MDRFIEQTTNVLIRKGNIFKIQYGQIYSLNPYKPFKRHFCDLKSNMDRFIAIYYFVDKIEFLAFKIQYGQIYSAKGEFINYFHKYLKSNMDRFIDPIQNAS